MNQILYTLQTFDYNGIFQTFLEAITFEMVLKFCIVYFFMIWIALLVWVIKDINNRTTNIFLQLLSILIILFFTPL